MKPFDTLRKRSAVRRKRDEEVRGLPGAVLLLHVALASGASQRKSLDSLARFGTWTGPTGSASRAIACVANRIALGASFSDALYAAEAEDEIGSSTHRVLDVLRRSELDGQPIGLHLEIMIAELRRERANALDVAAQRLTISLLFPLVLCILPAFIVLAVVPLVLSALSGLPT